MKLVISSYRSHLVRSSTRHLPARGICSFNTVAILVQLLSDGEEDWTLATPSRKTAIAFVQKRLRQWMIPTNLGVVFVCVLTP